MRSTIWKYNAAPISAKLAKAVMTKAILNFFINDLNKFNRELDANDELGSR